MNNLDAIGWSIGIGRAPGESNDEFQKRLDEAQLVQMATTEHYFKAKMIEIDPRCEVLFEIKIPCAIRIRPSNPKYRDSLRKQSEMERPMGVLVSIVKEIDDWGPNYHPMTWRDRVRYKISALWSKFKVWLFENSGDSEEDD
jgi:hypothetical protein